MVSFQTKDLKLSYPKFALSDCYLSFKSHVKGELFPLITIGTRSINSPGTSSYIRHQTEETPVGGLLIRTGIAGELRVSDLHLCLFECGEV